MRYFYRVLRKSKTNKLSFRRTLKIFADVSIRSRKSRQNNAFHSCPEAATSFHGLKSRSPTFLWMLFFLTKRNAKSVGCTKYTEQIEQHWLLNWKRGIKFLLLNKNIIVFFCVFLLQISHMYTNYYWWWSFLLFNLHPSFTPYFANHNGSLVQPPTG